MWYDCEYFGDKFIVLTEVQLNTFMVLLVYVYTLICHDIQMIVSIYDESLYYVLLYL